ncbi:MAG: xanthine dehydrogenase family protein molybdopterin-binding subunit [Rhodospirillaceae bacterium]|nr:xanthine dehydrogenase family protein molybdopterin-binding subunit [Rhodospirillaceae bacterium]MDD9914740.1 xanthine dehydrogenase family protein molybdopterin-binding subunit [Rhodospirillaceae bacterium]MDD9924811.1 xanthine dehydrogenase family protein molybdopterin-binding subunit [Rhodospirillaceae bacterium]
MDGSEGTGVGARVPRREDDRYMRGRGRYIGDIKLAGMKEVAFLRSPVAHGRIRGFGIPDALRSQVTVAADMAEVKAIRAVTALPGFKVSEQPALATDKVRYVGELVAMCLAPDRARAEDIVQRVSVDIEELPAIHDMVRARDADAPLIHEQWDENSFLESVVDDPNFDEIAAKAPIKITRTFQTARQCMSPIEGRGVVAEWDSRLEQLTVYSASQMPHIVRTGLSECLGLDHGKVRIIAPDVGGGFGYKGILLPEEVAICWLAMQVRHPVRWIEDRREQLSANANCREHHYVVTAHAEESGKLVALEATAHVDSGAYSAYPFSACLEAAQVGSILPGPYDFEAFRCRTWSSCTNKPPILPYRGVARTGVCFAMELMLDAIAREVGKEPHEIRQMILVPPEAMPFDNITAKHFDSGDYPECLRRAVDAIDLPAVRARQAAGEADGGLIGVGLSIFCEQGSHGTSVYSGWGIPMVPGHEQCSARLTPDGELELRIGAHSHGQGLETTLAQVANEVLGVEIDRVKLVHGDTQYTPYSTGTWGSRCMVMSGGAVATACEAIGERAARIGASLLQAGVDDVRIEGGQVIAPGGAVSLAEIARVWYLKPQDLPPDVDPAGLEVTVGYKPERDTGTFSYAAHAAVVAVDPELGHVEILDYAVVEDGGVLVNPMVVDGQVYGGVAQGIGTALYEEMPYDAQGQPLASTLADYLLPGTVEVPDLRILHMETPSPYTRFGQKGIGESGAIGPPAAIGNAINDALKELGVEVDATPITPRRLLTLIQAAQS